MKISQIAAQLFTCHPLLKDPESIAATLGRIRKAGYTAVEVCCTDAIPDDELNRILDGEGLTACSAHQSSEAILNRPEQVVERVQRLRCDTAVYPFPRDIDFSCEAAMSKLITQLQNAGEIMRAAGIVLCYHNHHQEFRKLGGRTILEQIYDGTTPEALQAEFDTYWIHYGGGDVLEWIGKFGGRMPLIHLKDYGIDSENRHAMAEVGSGNLNFKRIIPASEAAGCRWFIVEQDVCPGDPVDSLAASFRYLQENIVEG